MLCHLAPMTDGFVVEEILHHYPAVKMQICKKDTSYNCTCMWHAHIEISVTNKKQSKDE